MEGNGVKMMQNNKLDNNLFSLPFDQFSRQYYAQQIIEMYRTFSQANRLRILDIGGYKGKTAEFQPDDEVLIADLFDVQENNYHKVEPGRLPFNDGEFDVTASFDTYEHVPRDGREAFIKEAVRVSKSFHILAAPTDNNIRDVNNAEIIANQSYREMKGEDHRWLKEHIDYLIPTQKEIEQTLNDIGMYYVSLQTNELSLWLQMHQFFFCAELNSQCFLQVEKINQYFNKNLELLEAGIDKKIAYRRIYCITQDQALMERFANEFNRFKEKVYSTEKQSQRTSKLLEIDRLIHQGYMLLKTA